MLPGQVVYIGLLLQFIGQISYIASIFRGHAKPNLVSWFIWMLAPMIGFFFLVQAGAGFSALPIFMAGFGPAIIILFSIFIKNGYWKINAFDLYCGALALLALIFYVVTHNLGISIIFAMLSDSLAAVPTIVKSWKFPETESGLLFFLAMLSNILGLLTIKVWSFSISIFGIFVVIQCVVILFCIYRKKIFKF
ncbi:hypothetical protein A2W67_03630 [Candidatus Nomurabacteria bacterium RIFCSPLOWO2_02_40_28]|uniref:Uncharacterized protein n=2 Tax=Candidatus Nomuraibacteriota TaxID=1752729 RepID=A0A837HV52_9BACT|nr:MAG: hypothetical protein UT27_C0004G0038 [Candidatus Nomurabacteria bacterium GW2011_GWD2_39_12]KKR20900.1 MAG: hypothetical protein UT51_C0001G0038 [Candidatus Nomurabacteria bacterium GW2011_GWC2_39_41]KKR37221.1 MAG: hypothetical protein UT70_C0002G0057 [Candidatus Nomurabacteria bacterium GW2011_GWE2_40_10]KKR38849.1 MAG: hypothetical protein UT73_C0001G0037 [Candidatus Nomurabacteria bacterium GW2011_GWB1_40_11]KKR40047.1 MAG: hypothetical protein UT74_C0003G0038 [Parcubacteria group b